jgi:phospholipase/carboxylesterase
VLAVSSYPLPEAHLQLPFPYRLFTPEHFEARYQYPLVIWLHSDDSSEYELDGVMPPLSLRNYVAVGLRGSLRSPCRENCFRWSTRQASVALAEEMIFDVMGGLAEHHRVNPANVFLAGFGKAGTLAQMIGFRHPSQFAGVISINGAFPKSPRILSQWKSVRQLPLLWMHGAESEVCGVNALCEMLRASHAAGLQAYPIQFKCGHELDSEMLVAANHFMMQIVTGQTVQVPTGA